MAKWKQDWLNELNGLENSQLTELLLDMLNGSFWEDEKLRHPSRDNNSRWMQAKVEDELRLRLDDFLAK